MERRKADEEVYRDIQGRRSMLSFLDLGPSPTQSRPIAGSIAREFWMCGGRSVVTVVEEGESSGLSWL